MELVLVTEAFCRGCLGIGALPCASTRWPPSRSSSPAARRSAAAIWAVRPRGRWPASAHRAGRWPDVVGIRTRAERVQDGYVLTGSKLWISNANLAEFFVVFAKTDPAAGRAA